MILADTSAWVEFDRATGSAVDQRLTGLIRDSDPRLAVTEPVIADVVAGARTDERERDLRRLLGLPRLLPFEPVSDFDTAARVYRTCRGAGVTPRGLVDCLVVAVALRTGAHVLAADRDMALIATVVPLSLDGATG